MSAPAIAPTTRPKVLTVRQPWAWLIVAGLKTVENRTWRTHYRGPLYIHAGVTKAATPIAEIERRYGVMIDRAVLEFGAVIGCVELVDIVTQSDSPWFEGPFGWLLRGARAIEPVPMRGALGLVNAQSGSFT